MSDAVESHNAIAILKLASKLETGSLIGSHPFLGHYSCLGLPIPGSSAIPDISEKLSKVFF